MKKDDTIFEIGHISSNKNISGEFWMTNLSPLLRQLPLLYLCIPGTIKSHTYSNLLPENKRHQHSNITSQLFNGVRYFNVTVNQYKNSKWYCDKTSLADILRQFSLFALTHPNEVVFIEFQITINDDVECLNNIINRLLPILSTKKENDFWIQKQSLNSICKTGKNVILLYNNYHDNERIFKTYTKYIETTSTSTLDSLLIKAHPSICLTFKVPPYAIKVLWQTGKTFNFLKCKHDKMIKTSHEDIVNYITDNKTNINNLNKIFILCVEYECYIDILHLCMQIMDKRFFQ